MRKLFATLFVLVPLFSIAQTPEKPNIIFIMTDDMNDYVEGFDGHPQAETPNISSLADMGTIFYNAYSNSVLCAPSRTSFMSGKNPEYTSVMINGLYNCDFRSNFPPGLPIYTFPQILKDSAGYFTVSVGKLFHCDDGEVDYDLGNPDPCTRQLSWNKTYQKHLSPSVNDAGQANPQGIDEIKWSKIDSFLVDSMPDFEAIDSTIYFLQQYAANPGDFCDKPFMIALGIQKPHSHVYIPEQYFSDDYIDDFLAEPFDINYNYPKGSYPYNGLVMPALTDPPYMDMDSLGPLALEQIPLAPYNEFANWYITGLPYIPEIDPGLTDEERYEILVEAKKANGIMAYMAAIRFVDDMVGKLMDTLANYPDLYNNTIIVFSSDHGYSWGEKRMYGKSQMWETDSRVPFIIADLRNPNPQFCTKSVGLVDLFPTLMEMAGIEQPKNPDGTDYPDGHSLIPLMEDPDRQWEYPVLTQVKNNFYGNVCWPQNSIKNNRFHLIQFRSNGEGTTSVCDLPNSWVENYLYEVGEERNVDPEEWYNLAEKPEYQPVIQYLEEFLPGGSMYTEKAFTVKVFDKSPKCLYGSSDVIQMKAVVYNENGSQLLGPALADYQVIWSNSLTGETSTGYTYSFDLSTLTPSQFLENDKILFYAHVVDTDSGHVRGMEVKYAYINPGNKPVASFDVSMDGLTATVDPYTLTGSYTSSLWNFGDGHTTSEFVPGPYTYPAAGSYNIRNIVYYGNGCKRTFKKPVVAMMLAGAENERSAGAFRMAIIPNPANEFCSLQFNETVSQGIIRVYDMTGKMVMEQTVPEGNTFVSLMTWKLAAGLYQIELNSTNGDLQTSLQVNH